MKESETGSFPWYHSQFFDYSAADITKTKKNKKKLIVITQPDLGFKIKLDHAKDIKV